MSVIANFQPSAEAAIFRMTQFWTLYISAYICVCVCVCVWGGGGGGGGGKKHHTYSVLYSNSDQEQYHQMPMQCRKLGQFVLPETCESWFELVNNCFCSARETHEICQELPFSV